MASSSLDQRIDQLYRSDRARFVEGRDALAKELKSRGDREAAERVRALRKPTKAAWALNLVAHSQPDRVAELRDAGRALREAQDRAVEGGGHEQLREATELRRAVIHALTEAAVEQAGDAQRDQIAATLEASSVDAAVGDELRAARLTTDHRPPSGVGGLAELLAASETGGRRPDRVRVRQLTADLVKADEQLQRQRAALKRARERLGRAQQEVDELSAEVRELEGRRDELQADLDEANG